MSNRRSTTSLTERRDGRDADARSCGGTPRRTSDSRDGKVYGVERSRRQRVSAPRGARAPTAR
jgi:hypothetical protein